MIKYYKGQRVEVLPVAMKYGVCIRKPKWYLCIVSINDITDGFELYLKAIEDGL